MIPMQFHRLWYGPREMPQRYKDYGATWPKLNGGKLTDWLDYRPAINRALFDTAGTTWQPNAGGGKQDSAVAVQRADIASYELLYQYGGIYLNTDMEARRPLGDLLAGLDLFLVYEIDGEFPSNAMMGARPGHPFLAHVIDLLPKRVAELPGRGMNEQTGPHLLRQAVATWPHPVHIFPSRMFMPYSYNDMGAQGSELPDAYAEHHWGHKVPDTDLWGDE